MKYSKLFGVTVKDIPSELKTSSHKLLYKAGFIRQISAGRYAILPLGLRVWQKIMNIIEEEMVAVGSQRMVVPTLQPIEIWKSTNRDAAFGDEMHIVEDHHGATFVMGATGEGVMVELVKMFNPSYRNLPILVHQFSTKFRDEKRPKGGLMRVREFTMKDAYSFDKTEAESLKSYKKFYDAYLKIGDRLDLKPVPVLADSGAIGGEYNHEFIIESDSGEGEALVCTKCDYAAHVNIAESKFETYPQDSEMKEVGEHVNDKITTCEKLAEEIGIPLHVTTKTILFSSKGKFVAAMVRGDYDVNETKLAKLLDLDSLQLASEEDIKKLTGAKVGFMGPVNLPGEVELVADLTCADRTNFEVGGNRTGIHLYNLNFERDIPTPKFVDIRQAKEGDGCAKCDDGKLKKLKGIEWGHCFKLDQFYSKPHDAGYIKDDGKKEFYWMGSYGIGLGRSMATVVETHNDEKGMIWPKSIAPFDVHLVELSGASNTKKVYDELIEADIDVLWDDRDIGAGEKLADADLIGIPVRLVISEKTNDKVEWKDRDKKDTEVITITDAIERLQKS
jgi:prolyl-tRNA synthetase